MLQFRGMDSKKIADKHVEIGKTIHGDVAECRPDLRVYLTTHSGRTEYKLAEIDSGLEFWGMRLHNRAIPKSDTDIKHPDGVITDVKQGIAVYILEIKWGWIPDSRKTSDLSKMII